MLSDYENMDIKLESKELENQDVDMDSFINGSINRERDNVEANGENPSLDNEYRDIPSSSNSFQQDLIFRNLENITGQISQRFSREIETLVGTMNSRINDAIETAINERVLPRIQNIASETLNKEKGNGTIPDEARINRDIYGREPEICHNLEVNSEGEDISPDSAYKI